MGFGFHRQQSLNSNNSLILTLAYLRVEIRLRSCMCVHMFSYNSYNCCENNGVQYKKLL